MSTAPARLGSGQSGVAQLRILRGRPDPPEVAALTVVLSRLLTAARAAQAGQPATAVLEPVVEPAVEEYCSALGTGPGPLAELVPVHRRGRAPRRPGPAPQASPAGRALSTEDSHRSGSVHPRSGRGRSADHPRTVGSGAD